MSLFFHFTYSSLMKEYRSTKKECFTLKMFFQKKTVQISYKLLLKNVKLLLVQYANYRKQDCSDKKLMSF